MQRCAKNVSLKVKGGKNKGKNKNRKRIGIGSRLFEFVHLDRSGPTMYKTRDVAGAIRVPHRLQAHAHGIRMPRGPPAPEGCSRVPLDIHASLLAPSQTWPRAERTSVCTGCSRIGWAPRWRSCLIQQGRDRCDCPRGAPGLSSGTRLKADEAVLWMSSPLHPPVQVPPRCAYGVSIEVQSAPV